MSTEKRTKCHQNVATKADITAMRLPNLPESKEKGDHMISDKDLAACCLRRGLPNYFRRWSA